METRASLVDTLAQTSLFADLSRPELEAVAHEFDEEAFAEGQRVLRQGLSGSSLYVILDGAAVVQRDGTEIARRGHAIERHRRLAVAPARASRAEA